jgi:uncharacterized protein
MVSSWISPKARKGISSGIAGRGLFATEQIGAGEIVAVKGGHIVTTTQLRQLPDPLPNSEIQIADSYTLWRIARGIRAGDAVHQPLLRTQRRFRRQRCPDRHARSARRRELTTDYALFDDYEGRMTCHYNTASCRRVIDGHDWRRTDLQRR